MRDLEHIAPNLFPRDYRRACLARARGFWIGHAKKTERDMVRVLYCFDDGSTYVVYVARGEYTRENLRRIGFYQWRKTLLRKANEPTPTA